MDEMLLHHFIRKEHVEITLKTLSFQIEIKILCSIDLSEEDNYDPDQDDTYTSARS